MKVFEEVGLELCNRCDLYEAHVGRKITEGTLSLIRGKRVNLAESGRSESFFRGP